MARQGNFVTLVRGSNTVRVRRDTITAVRRDTSTNGTIVHADGAELSVDGAPDDVFAQCFPEPGDVLPGFSEEAVLAALDPAQYTAEWSGFSREKRRAMAYALMLAGKALGLTPASEGP